MNIRNRSRHLPLWLLLSLILAACTVVFEPAVSGRIRFNIELAAEPIITRFEPSRGEGANYNVGDTIRFNLRTTRSGYITLSATDPDGCIYTFWRNYRVQANTSITIPGSGDRFSFSLTPPRGNHRVRAAFTPQPTSGDLSYDGCGDEEWSRTIRREVDPFPIEARDVAETRFNLR